MYWDAYDERIKGFVYAEQPHRLRQIAPDLFVFEGRHSWHLLRFDNSRWVCYCDAYWRHCVLPYGGWCRHTVAAERILATYIADVHLPAFAAQPI